MYFGVCDVVLSVLGVVCGVGAGCGDGCCRFRFGLVLCLFVMVFGFGDVCGLVI